MAKLCLRGTAKGGGHRALTDGRGAGAAGTAEAASALTCGGAALRCALLCSALLCSALLSSLFLSPRLGSHRALRGEARAGSRVRRAGAAAGSSAGAARRARL